MSDEVDSACETMDAAIAQIASLRAENDRQRQEIETILTLRNKYIAETQATLVRREADLATSRAAHEAAVEQLHAEINQWRRDEAMVSAAYVRLRQMIPGALRTPRAPSPQEVHAITEASLSKLIEERDSLQAEVADLISHLANSTAYKEATALACDERLQQYKHEAREAREELARVRGALDQMQFDLSYRMDCWQKSEEEKDKLKAALEFYRDSWTANPSKGRFSPGLEWKPKEQLLDDCGNIAQAALSPMRDDKARGEGTT